MKPCLRIFAAAILVFGSMHTIGCAARLDALDAARIERLERQQDSHLTQDSEMSPSQRVTQNQLTLLADKVMDLQAENAKNRSEIKRLNDRVDALEAQPSAIDPLRGRK